jgi:hypothetical protein
MCTVTLLVFLWTYTALSKLANLHLSIMFLRKSPFASIAQPMAVTLPVIEILLAILLTFPATKTKALKLSLSLLSLFTLYIFYMLLLFSHRPCNCGGVINTMNWTQHIFFNLFFIIITAISINWNKKVDQPGHAENPHQE